VLVASAGTFQAIFRCRDIFRPITSFFLRLQRTDCLGAKANLIYRLCPAFRPQFLFSEDKRLVPFRTGNFDFYLQWKNLLNKTELGFQVVTAASMKMAVLWVVAPCSLVGVHGCFRGAWCLHHQGDDRAISTADINYRESHVMLAYAYGE
jgi:hypothetical protein